jgi:hypothetical protein
MQVNQPGYMPMQQSMYFPYPSPYGMDQINYHPRPAMPGMQPRQMNIVPVNYALPALPAINFAGTPSAAQPAPLPSALQVFTDFNYFQGSCSNFEFFWFDFC